MSLKQFRKGNPKWVRQGQGNKTGDYHWEYRMDGKYYAQGYYKTADEAYEACVAHQKWMDRWRNPEKHQGLLIDESNSD